jgi:hypothetical protein
MAVSHRWREREITVNTLRYPASSQAGHQQPPRARLRGTGWQRAAGWFPRRLLAACAAGVLGVPMLGLLTPAAASAGTAGVPAHAGPPAVAGTGWSVVPNPNAFARQGTLSDVSCTSPSRCVAVGSAVKPAGLSPTTLAEVWNGLRWAVQRTPANRFGELAGVSCTSALACTAVGGDAAERWNGTKWVTQALPMFTGAVAVSCSAAKFCATVGTDASAIWNGRTWVSHAIVHGAAFVAAHMVGISCTSASACMAVGYQDTDGNPVRALVNRWNGRKWVLQRFPLPPGTTNSGLSGVSCTSATACLAVGSGNAGPLVDRWNGTSWQPTPAPAGGPSAVLTHLSCTSANRCMATGTSSNGDLAEAWNGSRWRLLASPDQLAGTTLHALSCTSARACMVVGAHLPIGPQLTLAESWSGAKWTLEPPVNPRGRLATNLFAVSCAAAHACMAAGMASLGDGLQVTLAEAWNGKRWSVSPTPRRRSITNESLFNAVSCVSAADCTAVGYYQHNGEEHFLIEHWNGRRWNLPPAPDISGDLAALTGVSCTSLTACIAVGSELKEPGGGVEIAETWNGTTWSAQTLPAGAYAVSCSAANACTAVGGLTALRWDGTNWTVQTVPSPAGGSSFGLISVSCSSATSCTAVGNGHIGGAGFWSMLAVAWDGTDWTIQPTPQASFARSLFPRSVSCTTAAACTAVGKVHHLGVQQTLALHWNGTAWAIQPTPLMRNAATPVLNGVSCRSATACTAVGWWNHKHSRKALTERRT